MCVFQVHGLILVCDWQLESHYNLILDFLLVLELDLCKKLYIYCSFELLSIRIIKLIQRASEADYQSCSIEISDIYIYVCMYTYVKIFRPRF